MLAVLPQVEQAVMEYLVLLELLSQGEKLQAKVKEETAFLEGAEEHPDHLILTLEQRSFLFTTNHFIVFFILYFRSPLVTPSAATILPWVQQYKFSIHKSICKDFVYRVPHILCYYY